MIDLHNLHIEKRLRMMANPKSAERHEFVTKQKVEIVTEATPGYIPQMPFSAKDALRAQDKQSEKPIEKRVNDVEKMYTKKGEKDLECNYCSKKYMQFGYLKIHLKQKHEKELIIYCEHCHETFPEVSSLNRHQKCRSGCPNL